MKQKPFSFSLSFWIHIIPMFRKGRRKNSLSCIYLWQGLIFRLLSFTGECHLQNLAECQPILLTSVQRFCSNLFTGDFPGAWLNWRLFLANVCRELNFLFQTSTNEKDGVWTMGQSFGFFLLPPFHPVTIIEWPAFTSLSNRLQVMECG